MIINMIQGFCMALADSVPGVSGGTIAFLLGFYDRFINSVNDLLSTKTTKEKRIDSFKFLIKLGIGWVVGMGLSTTILASVFETGIYKVSSLFLGFIIAAIPVMIYEERKCVKGKYVNILWTIVGIAVVVGLSLIKPASNGGLEGFDIGMILYIILAGMIAISAMVLPGISGSTILLTFGLYMPTVTAVKELFHFRFSGLGLIICLAVGCIAGVLITLRLIKKALANYRSQTIYCVIGMMIGSLYAIVKGPTTLKTPQPAMNFDTFSIIFFIIGVAIVGGMQAAKMYSEKNKKADSDATNATDATAE